MRVVVLGAGGHIGSATVREFLRHGAEVTAAGRQHDLPANLQGLDIDYRPGDDQVEGTLEAWIAGHDLVVDAAAPYSVGLFDPQEHAARRRSAHGLDRLRRILRSTERTDAALVFVSSYVTLPRQDGLREGLPDQLERRLHPYFAAKAAMEELVLSATRHGMRALVVVPTACIGPWDRKQPEQNAFLLAQRGDLQFTTEATLNLVDVRDVARGIFAAVGAERWGRRIALSGHNLLWNQLTRRVSDIAGIPPPRLRIPTALAVPGALVIEALAGLFRRRTPFLYAGALLVRASHWQPISQEQRRLGIEPRPLSESIVDSIDWFRSIGAPAPGAMATARGRGGSGARSTGASARGPSSRSF